MSLNSRFIIFKDLCKCSNMEDLVSCLKQIDLTEAVAQVETSQVDLLRKQLTQLQKEKESWCTLKKYGKKT